MAKLFKFLLALVIMLGVMASFAVILFLALIINLPVLIKDGYEHADKC